MGKVKSYVYFAVTGLILICISLLISRVTSYTGASLAKKAGIQLENKLQKCELALQNILADSKTANKEEYYSRFENENIGLYLLKGNEAIFWNNSQIPLSDTLHTSEKSEGIIELKRGFYLYKKLRKDSLKAFSLCLVKSNYDLQNNHLKNVFAAWMNIPEEVELLKKTGTTNDVVLRGEKIFSLQCNDELYYDKSVSKICTTLFLIGVFVFFVSLILLFRKHSTQKNAILVLIPLFTFKILMIFCNAPQFLIDTILYDVHIFGDGDSIFNSTLADIVFNAGALLYIALVFYFQFGGFKSRTEKNIKIFFLFVLVFFIAWQFNHSLKSLVANSTLSFDFLNVFNIKVAAVIALLALVFNSISLFIVLYKASSFFNKVWWQSLLEFISYNLIICFILRFIEPNETFFQNFWLFFFSLLLFALVKFRFQRFSLGLGILIAFMSATSAGFFTHYINKNQASDLKYRAEELSQREDAYLENEFASLPQKIAKDGNLSALIGILPETKNEIDQFLKLRYFRGYFNTYNIDFSMFDKDCKPLLAPSQAILLNEGFFEDQIKYNSDSTSSRELFFVKEYKKNARYIAKIPLADYHLYVLLEKKQFEEQGSFPDLLLDASQQKHEKLKNLPHAVYRSGQRTYKYGDFNYPFTLVDSLMLNKSESGYLHHFFTPDNDTKIIISEKEKSWKYFFTYNSYLFLFFSIVSFLCYYSYALFFTANFKSASLTRRIQTIIIVLLLLAMSAVGITSGNLVSQQFEADNVKQLQEKTQAIMRELSDQFKDELFSSAQREEINLKLREFANLYNSDISLFDSEGGLFNTSQPKLYELGLAAPVTNPKAYFSLKENKTSSLYVTEKAGTLNYLSLYTPIFNENKILIGFVNLPYFAKQSDLTNELSSIISALINVYIILFVISILAGLILAGYITKPLRLIKQQISNITLGKQNETLKWESNDEVGKLVNEYNNMLVKLEHSANLLAQSERESAWREMAKQVAHEIKNPLTPMKLNLQYLQHVMKSNPDDFKEKFERASSSIIEQIDTLAAIATEFSNFAKLPGTQLQKINLIDIIQSSVNLFERKDGIIRLDIPIEEMIVMGDKEQALRIFNNIIKNAIDACKEVTNPTIRISTEVHDETYVIRISDNGCGIEEDKKSKIFTPNFTTKSTGSGLGLAMVKNIVANFGGKIWFESEVDKGSTFYLEFKKGSKSED